MVLRTVVQFQPLQYAPPPVISNDIVCAPTYQSAVANGDDVTLINDEMSVVSRNLVNTPCPPADLMVSSFIVIFVGQFR